MPHIARPPDSTSRVATVLARWAMLRYVTPVTRVPSRAVSVRPARKARVVQLSSMSSQCGPTGGICRKWSITQMLVKPASSAVTASSDSRSRVSAGPPGNMKRGICRPNSRGMGASCWRAAAAGAATRSGATTMTSPGGWTAANPSSARASRTSGHRASIEAITLAGIDRGRARLRARHVAASVSKTTATHGAPASAAARNQRRRRLSSVPRESTTVVSRRRRRRSITRSSTSKASFDARWSCSPVPTTARRRSDDTTWCGGNCEAAHVDFPDAGGPTSTTSDPSASRMVITGQPARSRQGVGAKASSVASTSPSG